MVNDDSVAVNCSKKLVIFDRTERHDRVSQYISQNKDTFIVLERHKSHVPKKTYNQRKAKLLLRKYRELRNKKDIVLAFLLSRKEVFSFFVRQVKSSLKETFRRRCS